jgi:hypothetical protein
MNQRIPSIVFLVLTMVLFSNKGYGQQTDAPAQGTDKKWHYLADIYLLFPTMKGETGIDDIVDVPIDASTSDIFSNLKMGGMVYFEANTNKWAITTDLVFMNLNTDIEPGKLFHSGNVSMKQFIWETDGFYRINSFFEAGLGARLYNLQTGIDARRNVFPMGTEEVMGSHSDTWCDPVVTTRLAKAVNNKWFVQCGADVGGFGIGSELSWQLQGYAGYHFTKVFQMRVGYRYLSIDYQKGIERTGVCIQYRRIWPCGSFWF